MALLCRRGGGAEGRSLLPAAPPFDLPHPSRSPFYSPNSLRRGIESHCLLWNILTVLWRAARPPTRLTGLHNFSATAVQ